MKNDLDRLTGGVSVQGCADSTIDEESRMLTYSSGDEVRAGDRIRYHGEPGEVEFVVTALTGDPQLDWYMREFPGGGYMIKATGFGNVFLTTTDEHIELISRSASQGTW